MTGNTVLTALSPILGRVIDKVFPDNAEAERAKAELATAIGDVDARFAEAGASVMTADAVSQSWLARNARPIISLTGLGAAVALVITAIVDPARGAAAADALVKLPTMLWVTVLGPIGLWFPLRHVEKRLGLAR